VVTKEYGGSSDAPILTVSELWTWRYKEFVLSAYSELGKNPAEFDNDFAQSAGKTDLRFSIPGMDDHTFNNGVISPEDIISRMLAHQIDEFGDPQTKLQSATGEQLVSYPSTLEIFEVAVVQVLSDVTKYMDSANSTEFGMRSKTYTEASMREEMRLERGFIDNISDIKSELSMIDEILSQQEEIISTMIVSPKSLLEEEIQKRTPETYITEEEIRLQGIVSILEDARLKIHRYRKRVIKIDNDAGRIEKTIQDQLNLKRTYASLQDAHASVELGRTSAHLGTAVIGFTIVTIIFAPIAFMASIFALPIDSLNAHKTGESQSYSTGYLGWWFGMCLAALEIHPS
jgi:hypothetical protein